MELDAPHTYEHLGALYGGVPGYVHISGTDNWNGRRFSTDDRGLAAAVDYAIDLDRQKLQGIYCRATTLTDLRGKGRGGAKDTCHVPYLFADIDYGHIGHKGDNLPPDADAAFALVAEAGLPEPTRWVHSGGGWYPLWVLEPDTAIDAAQLALEGVQQALGRASEAHGWRYGNVGELARVLRLPGSVNRKVETERRCEVIVP